jgi:hypothetical protein
MGDCEQYTVSVPLCMLLGSGQSPQLITASQPVLLTLASEVNTKVIVPENDTMVMFDWTPVNVAIGVPVGVVVPYINSLS